jgi:hypothetical protein
MLSDWSENRRVSAYLPWEHLCEIWLLSIKYFQKYLTETKFANLKLKLPLGGAPVVGPVRKSTGVGASTQETSA